MGAGCCASGAADAIDAGDDATGNTFDMCQALCNQDPTCNYVSYGWKAGGHASTYCSTKATCTLPLKSGAKDCGAGGGNNGVHTYHKVSAVVPPPPPTLSPTVSSPSSPTCEMKIVGKCAAYASMNDRDWFDDSNFGGAKATTQAACDARQVSWVGSCGVGATVTNRFNQHGSAAQTGPPGGGQNRRRVQRVPLSISSGTCPLASLNARVAYVQRACPAAVSGSRTSTLPTSCGAACAVEFHALFSDCSRTLRLVKASMYDELDSFHSECLGLSPGELLDTLDRAVCDVNECASRPCSNAAECRESTFNPSIPKHAYACNCRGNYGGHNCNSEEFGECRMPTRTPTALPSVCLPGSCTRPSRYARAHLMCHGSRSEALRSSLL